ncbi:pentapeptide repeat-containing protein [Flavobacterium microcysteis]|jgi:uncharacterized protein YjbI with pentapeptide repeats|uniref:Pentapeptide repeat-containing protein n=1 Tax=Flavobacterium microcysteis TaxID=2596891 RepID=A0A501Q526_9FLAO|nr:pentapeptide repeat-containing protein [Flavobacterium microcysteis]TPD67116.1 pentapeptide repeat-containing protein [Flavobacterium microcysteis]
MKETVHIGKTFSKVIYTEESVQKREFENCTFIDCDLYGSDFSQSQFIDCSFKGCNLSMIKLNGTGLKNVEFESCKMMGIGFDYCDDFLFEVRFSDCTLDFASFARKKMQKIKFINSSMQEVNFSETDLTKAIFEEINLNRALFNRTILIEADLSKAYNFSIDPELNSIKKAKFSLKDAGGLLEKYNLKLV